MNKRLDLPLAETKHLDSAQRPWRVLIANAWGGNRGDEAMLNTLNRLLRSISPSVKVDVMPFRNEDLDIDTDMQVHRKRIGEYWYADIPDAMSGVLESRVPRRILRVLTALLHDMGVLASSSLVDPYDLVISAPQGPTLGDMYNAKERIVEPLRIAQSRGKPYMVLAVSAGPFNKQSPAEDRIGRVLKGARRIVVREELSLSNLTQKYPDLGNVEAAIDIVYALRWSLAGKRAQDLDDYQRFVNAMGENAVGACISMTPARDPANPFSKEAYITQFVGLVDHVLGRSSAPLVLFPHLAFDMPALEQIQRRARFPERVLILPPTLDSDFQRDLISKLGFFISSRYHPTIFAVQAGVPFLCIKNQFKVEGMLQKIGLGHIPTCWQDESPEAFARSFDACWNEREALRIEVGSAAGRAAELAALFQRVLHEEYDSWASSAGDTDLAVGTQPA